MEILSVELTAEGKTLAGVKSIELSPSYSFYHHYYST